MLGWFNPNRESILFCHHFQRFQGQLWRHGNLYDQNPAEFCWNRPKTVIFLQTFCFTYWWDLQVSCEIARSTICISSFSVGVFRRIISLFRIFIFIQWSKFFELEYWFSLSKSSLCFAWRWISSVQLSGCTSWIIFNGTNFYNAMIVNCITAFCLKLRSWKGIQVVSYNGKE